MVSKAMIWTGRVLSTLVVLLMVFGVVYSFVKPDEVMKGFDQYGYPARDFHPILFVEIACVVLYMIPQTAVLGAILLTGYLGGATATHVRISDPMWIMPVIVGIVVWLGLYLRDPKLRALVPLRW